MGEVLAIDTVLHLLALGVAVGYGYKNRQPLGAGIAIGSPLVFVVLLAVGPSESTGAMIGPAPTDATIAVAYVVANAVLAYGLWLTSTPAVRDSAVAERSAGDAQVVKVRPSGPAARRSRLVTVMLVATPLVAVVLAALAFVAWIYGAQEPDYEPPRETRTWVYRDGSDTITTTTQATVSTTTTAPSAPQTTVHQPSTTAPTTSTPLDPARVFVVSPGNLLEPPPQPGSGGALGSGCTPNADTLPDGVWVGWIILQQDSQFEFDLACMYATPEEPMLTNQSTRLRSVATSTAAIVYPVTEDGDIGQPIPYPTWWSSPTSRFCETVMITPSFPKGCPVWLYINGGEVTEVVEFWLP